MTNRLLKSLEQGAQPVGTFFVLDSAAAAECLGLSGIDYMIIDTEHGPFGVERTVDLLRAGESRGATVLARVPDSSRPSVLKMLDIGIHGIIVPNIRSVQEAKDLVEYGKFHPLGMRGVNFTRSAGYGYAPYAKDLGEYFQTANAQTMLIPQCETVECLEHIDEIAAIDGISAVFVGPFDLSVAMGIPAQFHLPQFQEALSRIQRACRDAGKYCFTFATDAKGARDAFAQGFDSVAVGIDTQFYTNAYKQMLEEVRG